MNRIEFRAAAERNIVLDGATGTELVKRGMPAGVCPELWVFEHPDVIADIHRAYRAAGSGIVLAPTFGGNRCKLAEYGLEKRQEEIIGGIMRMTAEAAGVPVFGDIAPTGRFVEPYGDLPFEEAVGIFRKEAEILRDNGAAGIFIETMTDLQEARAAYLGAREACPDLPVAVCMTFEPSGRSLTGTLPEAALITLQSLGCDAFGCNCSAGPEEMAKIISAMRGFAKIPLIAKPNAGVPKFIGGKTVFPMEAEEFGAAAAELVKSGAALIGGCCGTSPAHTAALGKAVQVLPAAGVGSGKSGAICSPGAVRVIAPEALFTVIGERINPTGKKALQEELRKGCTDMIFDFAVQQAEAGAGILDVNVGMAGIDEAKMLPEAVKRAVRAADPPLCIDSTDPEAVERALRVYPGRALLNSVSAEKKRLGKILPVAAKYGAMIIVLPLSDAGVPADADERMRLVDVILSEAEKYGYSPDECCVDALIMTAAADAGAPECALEVIARCAARGLNTVCGLSNISFGFPARRLINRAFLGMAIGRGLNAAIANPLFSEVMETAAAGDVLTGRDCHAAGFIASYGAAEPQADRRTAALPPDEMLKKAVLDGNPAKAAALAVELLDAGTPPETVLNGILIPAITEVGNRYERKQFFLPQLIAGAEAMQSGIAVVEPRLTAAGKDQPKRKIVLATVKGDIHDIGKNIVAVMLRNCDFEVIDLGKDVPPEKIIDTAVAAGAKVVGLSALMTTTLGAMRETVECAKKRGLKELCFLVGGAVVDAEFAGEIGAVYTPDPVSTARAAETAYGGTEK